MGNGMTPEKSGACEPRNEQKSILLDIQGHRNWESYLEPHKKNNIKPQEVWLDVEGIWANYPSPTWIFVGGGKLVGSDV